MQSLLSKLDRRFRVLEESPAIPNYRDPNNPDVDRQYVENCLFNTIGPLTDTPRWNTTWDGDTDPPPDFTPGGPAPKWTEDEVTFAMAGDPNLLFRSTGHPKSPSYGNRGGAPLWRLAKKVSRIYNRSNDKQFIADMYSNGLLGLSRLMQPGYDESRSPFISFAMRNLQSAMEHGVGGTEQGIRASGGESKTGAIGLRSVLDSTDPAQLRQIANQVKGKYQNSRSNDKHPDNPFGQYSSKFYQLTNLYADALEAKDEDKIEAAQNQIQQLMGDIEDDAVLIPGASTGMGQAVSTGDRKSHVKVASMDYKKDDEAGSYGDTVASDDHLDNWIDPETVKHVLDIAINYDIGKLLGKSPKFQKIAADAGIDKFGGPMTANELRCIIRSLGELGSNYPGVGIARGNTNIPRDVKGWWRPGEDPEIEPIPNSKAIWKSIWSRNNYQRMGSTDIAKEMTDEVREFTKLGIPTGRKIASKKGGKEEAVSKVAVNTAINSAFAKLHIISAAEKATLGLDESLRTELGLLINESIDKLDGEMIIEAYHYIMRSLLRTVREDAPKGWKGTVSAMKKHHPDKFGKGEGKLNPFAIAHSMANKGAKSHYKNNDKAEKKESFDKIVDNALTENWATNASKNIGRGPFVNSVADKWRAVELGHKFVQKIQQSTGFNKRQLAATTFTGDKLEAEGFDVPDLVKSGVIIRGDNGYKLSPTTMIMVNESFNESNHTNDDEIINKKVKNEAISDALNAINSGEKPKLDSTTGIHYMQVMSGLLGHPVIVLFQNRDNNLVPYDVEY